MYGNEPIPRKKYVDVMVLFEGAEMIPKHIIWEDGRKYEIDKSIKIGQRPSKAGGAGIMYKIRVS